jgi:hypothetical protein
MPTNTFQQLRAVAEGRLLQGIGESDSDFGLRSSYFKKKPEEESMHGPPDKVVVLKRSDSASADEFANALSEYYDAGFSFALKIERDGDTEVYLEKYPGKN